MRCDATHNPGAKTASKYGRVQVDYGCGFVYNNFHFNGRRIKNREHLQSSANPRTVHLMSFPPPITVGSCLLCSVFMRFSKLRKRAIFGAQAKALECRVVICCRLLFSLLQHDKRMVATMDTGRSVVGALQLLWKLISLGVAVMNAIVGCLCAARAVKIGSV